MKINADLPTIENCPLRYNELCMCLSKKCNDEARSYACDGVRIAFNYGCNITAKEANETIGKAISFLEELRPKED